MSTSGRRRWVRRIGVGFGITLVGLVLAGIIYQTVGRMVDARRHPPPGELVDVGAGRLHLHCLGEGEPTTVLDAGGGDSSLVWRAVQAELAEDVRACAFDRAGFGWSDTFDRPHTVDANVELQERLLRASGLEGPYLLVGHSLGGLNAQVYAARNPDAVAGLVLVDAAHPELFQRVPELTDAESGFVSTMRVLSRLGVARFVLATGLVDPLEGMTVSPEVHAAYLAQFARPRHWDSVQRMGADLATSLAATREIRAPRDVPAVVLTHDVPDMFVGLDVDGDEVERIWQELQAGLVEGFDDGRLVVVEGSGHMIPLAAPGAVVEAVRDVLASDLRIDGRSVLVD